MPVSLTYEEIVLATDIMWTACGQKKTYLFHPRGELMGTHANTENVVRYLDHLADSKILGQTINQAVMSFITDEFGITEEPIVLDQSYRTLWMQDDNWYDWLDSDGNYIK